MQAITIVAFNPSTGSPWKSNNCAIETETKNQLINCMEDNAYLVQDILISKDIDKFQPVYEKDKIVGLFSSATNQSVEIQTYYLDTNGLPHIFKPEAGVITKYVSSTLHIDLNMNLSYFEPLFGYF